VPRDQSENIIDFLIFFTHTVAYFSVALLWLESTDRAMALSHHKQLFRTRVVAFRVATLGILAVFTVLMAVLMARNDSASVAILAVILSFSFVCLFARVTFRLWQILREVNAKASLGMDASSMDERVRRMLGRIQRTAMLLCIFTSSFLFAFIAYSTNVNNGNTPDGIVAGMCVQLVWFFAACTTLVLAEYLAVVARSVLQHKEVTSSLTHRKPDD